MAPVDVLTRPIVRMWPHGLYIRFTIVNPMETVASKIPKPLVDEMDRLVRSGRFANRSEVMRVAVRDFLGAGRPAAAPGRASDRTGEIEAFRRRLSTLARDPRYRNRWIALHDGEPLDADEDKDALVRRILERREEPIHIGFATEEPKPLRVRSPGVRVRGRA